MSTWNIGPISIRKIQPSRVVSLPIDNINGTGDVQVMAQFRHANGTVREWETELVLISKLLFEMILSAVIYGKSSTEQELGDDDINYSIEVSDAGNARFIVDGIVGSTEYQALQLLRDSFLIADGELQPALAQGGINAALSLPIAGLRMGARPFVLRFPENL